MENVQGKNRILSDRRMFADFFEKKAAQSHISLRPTRRDDKTTVLTQRLFEEESGSRIFIVCLGEKGDLEVFTKTTGLTDDKVLMNLFIEPSLKNFEISWSAYVMWMHELKQISEVEGYIFRRRDG